jgi:methyl-accepting chemotaxis protein
MGIMSETAIAQSKTSDKVVDNIAVLKNMIEHTYNEIQQLNQTKRTMQLEERRVENVVNNLTYINASLNEIIEVINSQVETTYNSANKIKKSAELISEFADETNLLALNAAIEAARVGEQGKGFAIVANQIKQLADQSNVVSMNISNDIGELVKDSNKSLVTMEEVNTVIGKLNDNIVITEDVFTQINTGIDDVSQRVDQIKHSVEKMDDASTSIWEVTDELKEIAKKNSKCASDTNSVTDYMTELFTEASKLKKVSDELADSMKVFKL